MISDRKVGIFGLIAGVVGVALATLFYFFPIDQPEIERKLTMQDFRVTLDVYVHHTDVPTGYQLPDAIQVSGYIGDIKLESRMAHITEAASSYGGGRSPNYHWRFEDKSPIVTGIGEVRFSALQGKSVEIYLPRRAIRLNSPSLKFKYRVIIAGQEFLIESKGNQKLSGKIYLEPGNDT